ASNATAPASQPPVANSALPKKDTVKAAAEPATSSSISQKNVTNVQAIASPASKTTDSSVASASAQTATVVTPESSFLRNIFWIVGLILLVSVFSLLFWLMRRSRADSHASLISRSLDRGAK